MLHRWPGNVRELANVVERAVALSTEGEITADRLLLGREEFSGSRHKMLPLNEAREEFERAYLFQILTATGGNVSRAASVAGRYRAEFYKLLRKYDLDPDRFRNESTLAGSQESAPL